MIAEDEIELVTRRAEYKGFVLIATQRFVRRLRGGGYDYVIFDPNGNLVSGSFDDLPHVYFPADERNGRMTQTLAELLLRTHVDGYQAVLKQVEAGQADWLTGE